MGGTRSITLDKYWKLSFKIQPTGRRFSRFWKVPTNIVKVSATGEGLGLVSSETSGANIPQVSFQWWNRVVRVCMSCDGSGDTYQCFTHDESLPIKKWSTVSIFAWAGELIIDVRGGGMSQRKTESCEAYEPMKGDVGKLNYKLPWEGVTSVVTSVSYKRLGFQIEKGNLINSQLRISNGFNLSFNIKPYREVPGGTSIIHVTETGENSGKGARQPAVFFHSDSTRLLVCAYCQTSMTASKEVCVPADYDLPLGKTSSVVISMKKDPSIVDDRFRKGTAHLTLTIRNDEGNQEKSEFCGWPYEPSSSTAEMYYGNPWNSPAEAELTNVVYTATNLDEYGRRRVVSEADRTVVASEAEPSMGEDGAELQGELLAPASSQNQRA